MPGTSTTPGGNPADAGPIPATVSWSVSAIASTPATAARRITSAGGRVPSEAELWLCRSARTRRVYFSPLAYKQLFAGPSAGEAGGASAERQVEVLAWITQITERHGLDQQGSRGVRPEQYPQPAAHYLADEGGTPRRVNVPKRQLVVAELDLRVRRGVRESITGVRTLETGAASAQADPEFLADEQHLAWPANGVRPRERDSAALGAAALVADRGEAGDQPPVRERPRQHHRDLGVTKQPGQTLGRQALHLPERVDVSV